MPKNLVVALTLFAASLSPISSFAADPPLRAGNVINLSKSKSFDVFGEGYLGGSLVVQSMRLAINFVTVISDPTKEMKTCADPAYNYAQELVDTWGFTDPTVIVVFFTDDTVLPMIGKTPSLNSIFLERKVEPRLFKAVIKTRSTEGKAIHLSVMHGMSEVINAMNLSLPMPVTPPEPPPPPKLPDFSLPYYLSTPEK